jgi:predicted PurR-regulated permease PerM
MAAIAVMVGGSIQEFTREAPKYRTRIAEMYGEFIHWLQVRGVPLTERVSDELINPADALDMMTGTLRRIAAVLSNLLLVFLTIVFILFEASGFPAKLQKAFGKPESSERFEKIRWEIQRFLGIKSIISLATGILIGTSMWLVGIDFPMLWGGLAFLLNYIPTLGSVIAGVPPVVLAMITLGPGYALVVALIFLTVNITLGNLVEPYLMGRRLGLSTLVVFLSLVFWGWIWGPVGMLLSVPLTMIVKIFVDNFEDLRWLAVLLDRAPPPREAQTD